MRTAIFSDIHANWEALSAAAEHTKKQKIDRIVVLGDSIGYGANPNECLAWVMEHAAVNLLGNHEKAIIDPAIREWFSDIALDAILWTEKIIDPALTKKIRDLVYLKIEKDLTFAHASVHEPEKFHYLNKFPETEPTFRAMKSSICFVGHTHRPCCFCESERSAVPLTPGVVRLKKGERYILNPGSVGQTRDNDWRLAYGIFDDQAWTFEILRLEYENQKAAEKIRRAGLPRFLAERLL